MSVVLVHGNPETTAVWDPLRAALDRHDVVCLSPPGFGAPLPNSWGATVEDYRDWLISEREHMGSPVDLVGHDWGGGHVVAVAMKRPDLLRSWCTDVIGVFDAEYVWHDLAQLWQTPGAGEEAVEAWASESVDERAARLRSFGVTPDVATKLAEGYDMTMARCILTLPFGGAAQDDTARQRPRRCSTASWPASERHQRSLRRHHRHAAASRRARRSWSIEVLDGLGHWWMVQDPQRGATALQRFWSSLKEP